MAKRQVIKERRSTKVAKVTKKVKDENERIRVTDDGEYGHSNKRANEDQAEGEDYDEDEEEQYAESH